MSRTESQNWLRRTRRSHSSARPRKTALTRPFEGANLERLEERVLMTFTPIAQPTVAYTSATTVFPIFSSDGTTIANFNDGVEAVAFSPSLTAATVPTSFGTWGSPPNTETATPRVVFNAGTTTETFTLSKPASTFGMEIEPDAGGAAPVTATFFNGATSLGTITQNVNSVAGALLFAGTSDALPITSVSVTEGGAGVGFGFAQFRYNLVVPPLTGSTGNAITGVEGSSTGTVLLGTFVDANQASTAADYTTPPGSVVVNWGDGSAPQTLAASNLTPVGTPPGVVWTINAAHTYTEEGTYAYTVTVTDARPARPSRSPSFPGRRPSPTRRLIAGAPTALTPNTGIALPSTTVVATFTDGNSFATTADHTASIDWGDGSAASTGVVLATATPGVFDVEGSHTYAKPGADTTLVSVHDDGGSQVVVHGTSVVTDLPVTGSAKTFTTVEGQNTGTFVLATFEDPNKLATVADVQAALAVGGWGDGTPGAAGVQLVVQQTGVDPANGEPTFEILGSHTYAEETGPGTPDPLSVIITTLGGATTTLTSPPGVGVTVLDAKLSSTNGTTITGVEGINTGNVLLGSFRDANQGPTADFTSGNGSITVNWGDGTPAQTLNASNLNAQGTANGVVWSILANHTYAEEGTYGYQVTVTDDGGSVTIFSGSAVIADASLVPVPTTISTVESPIYPVPVFGAPIFKGPVANFTDANPNAPLSDFKATIDWGDGTSNSAGTIVPTPGGPARPSSDTGSHTYADAGVNGGIGTYAITVFVSDVGGSRVTILSTANVADIPIHLTGILNPTSDSGLLSGALDTTDVKQPDFFGSSEPRSHVTLIATPLVPGGIPIRIGQGTASSSGAWNIKSLVSLRDGHYQITATAIDQFGKTTTTTPTVVTRNLLIDTVGPVIAGASFNRLNGQVDFIIRDPAAGRGQAPSGVWLNSLVNSANYLLTKVQAGKVVPARFIATDIAVTRDPTIPFAYDVDVTFNGANIIKGGNYLFTIRGASDGNSSVEDRAGNQLEGVFYGSFPSGNGINGSDFVAELEAIHNKVFAPQTVVGTADASNNGVGGLPVDPIHSGVFVTTVPKGGKPVFSTPTSPVTGLPSIAVLTTAKAKAAAITVSKSVPKGPKSK